MVTYLMPAAPHDCTTARMVRPASAKFLVLPFSLAILRVVTQAPLVLCSCGFTLFTKVSWVYCHANTVVVGHVFL